MTAAQRKTVWSLVALGGVIFAIWKLWPLVKEKLGGSSSGTGVSGSGASNAYTGDYYPYPSSQQSGLNSLIQALTNAFSSIGRGKGSASSGAPAGPGFSFGSPSSASQYSGPPLLTPSATSITQQYLQDQASLVDPGYISAGGIGGNVIPDGLFTPTYTVYGPTTGPFDSPSAAGAATGAAGAAAGAADFVGGSSDAGSYSPVGSSTDAGSYSPFNGYGLTGGGGDQIYSGAGNDLGSYYGG